MWLHKLAKYRNLTNFGLETGILYFIKPKRKGSLISLKVSTSKMDLRSKFSKKASS